MRTLLFIVIFFIFLLITKTSTYAETIKINEFSSAAGTSSDPDWPDWVEIYYEGVDTTLYQLRDAANNSKNLADAVCAANFCTVDWSNKLNNSGDTIKLVLISNPDSVLDQVIYGDSGDVIAPSTGQSAGRNTDGTGNWILFSSATKNASNNASSPAPTPTSVPATDTPIPPTATKAPNTPTPIKTPTPNLTSTPVSSPTPTKTPTKASSPTPKTEEPSVLSENVTVEPTKEQPTPTPPTLTAGFFQQNLPKIFIIGGGLFLLCAGILFYKTQMKGDFDETDSDN